MNADFAQGGVEHHHVGWFAHGFGDGAAPGAYLDEAFGVNGSVVGVAYDSPAIGHPTCGRHQRLRFGSAPPVQVPWPLPALCRQETTQTRKGFHAVDQENRDAHNELVDGEFNKATSNYGCR